MSTCGPAGLDTLEDPLTHTTPAELGDTMRGVSQHVTMLSPVLA